MPHALSKVSSKYQTVIPREIRRRLGLRTGDTLRFNVTDRGAITVDKVREDEDDPFASFTEWRSEEDERLYRDI